MNVNVFSVKLMPASFKFESGIVKYNEPFLCAHLTGAACAVNISVVGPDFWKLWVPLETNLEIIDERLA